MEKEFYIYVWYRKDDGIPFYVGKGKGTRYRQLVNRNKYFLNVYKKHGGFSKKIIKGLTESEAIEKEISTIKEYRGKYTLTNITDGGEGVSGLHHTNETKKILSEISKNQWKNPKMKELLIKSRRKTHSDIEFRKHMSEVKKGQVLSQEDKIKQKIALNKPEVKKKMSKAKTKYTNIECITPSGEHKKFDNTREIVNWLKSKGYKKVSMPNIIGCITGLRKTTLGFKFKLLNQESE